MMQTWISHYGPNAYSVQDDLIEMLDLGHLPREEACLGLDRRMYHLLAGTQVSDEPAFAHMIS